MLGEKKNPPRWTITQLKNMHQQINDQLMKRHSPSVVTNKIQITITMRNDCTPTRMAKTDRMDKYEVPEKIWNKWNSQTLLAQVQIGTN